jgi:hypothetical protein
MKEYILNKIWYIGMGKDFLENGGACGASGAIEEYR